MSDLYDLSYKIGRIVDCMKMDLNPNSIDLDKDFAENLDRIVGIIINSLKSKNDDDEEDCMHEALYRIKKFRNNGDYHDLIAALSNAEKYMFVKDTIYFYEKIATASNSGLIIGRLVDYYARGNLDKKYGYSYEGLPPYEKLFDYNNFVKWVKFGANTNSYRFKYILAEIYLNGYGFIKKDSEKAKVLLLKLLDNEEPQHSDTIYKKWVYALILSDIYFDEGKIVDSFYFLLKYYTHNPNSSKLEKFDSKYLSLFRMIKNDCVSFVMDPENPDESEFSDREYNNNYKYYKALEEIIKQNQEEKIEHIKQYNIFLEKADSLFAMIYNPNSYDYDHDDFDEEFNNLKEEYKSAIDFVKNLQDSTLLTTSDFKFEQNDDYLVAKKYIGNKKTIKIPSFVDNLPVKKLADNLFYKKQIKKVIIPDTIEEIGEFCFSESGIESVVLPSGIKSLLRATFADCTKLKEVVIPPLVEVLEPRCFSGCAKLTNIHFDLSSKLQIIRDNCFLDCCSLIEISIPGTVFLIEKHAFSNCEKLRKIAFTAKRNHLETKCAICGDDSENGDLCFACNTPQKINTVIEKLGSSIQSNELYIMNYAFLNCKKLINLVLPDNLVYIGEEAFKDCKSLRKVLLRKNINTIGKSAFDNCEKLTIYIESDHSPWGWEYKWHGGRDVEFEVDENEYNKIK